jgi:hypothetical protein
MTRKTAAQRRRARNLRIGAWIILLAAAAFAIVRFLALPGWGQATIIVALILLALLWFVISRRREIAEEMDRRRDES